MFGNQTDTIDTAMRDIYTSGYYQTAFEIQKGIGTGWNLATLDDKLISKVIKKPWAADGKNFSERIWGNRQRLVNELNQTLTQGIILGQDPQKAIDSIAKKMNTSKVNAGRLVMTEQAYFAGEARKDCFKELDVEEFEVVATLDSRTSEICQDMDGKHFPMSQWEVGVTAPPFHVNCRSCTAPYFEDDFGVAGVRAARAEDGSTYEVSADMTYKEWERQFVGKKPGLRAAGDGIEKGEVINSQFVTLESIAVSDENVVLSKLQEYEKTIADSAVENAIVITADGSIVQCTGTLNGVYPDIALGGRLKGAWVTHNHPAGSRNEYSFSSQDIELFMDNELAVLRGIDEKYIYELTRNPDELDEFRILEDLTEYDGRHEVVIDEAIKLNIGYRRYRRE
jgi:SPP1 gp7 family putative phage head morphogenesis protein